MIKYREALKTWRTLVQQYDRSEQLCLDLFAHPDASPEDIAKVREKLLKGRPEMREGYKQMLVAQNKFGTMWLSPVKPVKPVKPAFMEKRS